MKFAKNCAGLEREDLGIYAKARGMMLYDGNVYPVDAQSFEGLGKKGVFMLVIEKEGIADVDKGGCQRLRCRTGSYWWKIYQRCQKPD